MFADERCDRIVEMLKQKNSVTVSELTEIFGVSIETIRRDLCLLENHNKLRRVHGGAISVNKMNSYSNLVERLDENITQKQYLSSVALKTLHEGDVIAIDSGSTAVEFIRLIKENFNNLKIITYSLDIFEHIKKVESFETILIGGTYMPKEDCFYGDISVGTIKNLHVKTSFICPAAISLHQGVYEHLPEIATVQKAFMQNSDQVIALADSSKFEKTAFYKICDIKKFDKIITDNALSEEIIKQYKDSGLNIINK